MRFYSSKSELPTDSERSDESNASAHHKSGTRDDPATTSSGDKAAEETPYFPIFANVAKVMCMDGAPHWRLASAFKVDESTIYERQRTHKDFAAACKYGANFADDRVERSLYQLAVGYEYRDVKVFCYRGHTIYAPYLKHVVASVEAAIFWLVNRRPEEWRYKPEAKQNIKPESDLARAMKNMTFDTLRPKEN